MSRASMRVVAAVCMLVATACGGRITDPGAVDDKVLNEVLAQRALVNGMSKTLSRALNWTAYTGAAVSREVVGSGSTAVGLFGITVRQRQGLLDAAVGEANDHWELAQQARWVAEDGVRRMRDVYAGEFGRTAIVAEALLHAGFANRLLGENMCDAVIDGGTKEPRSRYFDLAESAFSEAMTVAAGAGNQNFERAARAGRASVRVWLGDWQGAVADAQAIPANFAYTMRYSTAELEQYNKFFWANGNQPYRAHSVVGTFYDGYYTVTNDPRTPWRRDPAIPTGTQANVPWYFQTKFDRREAPIRLVSGSEMRLIVAESMIRSGDWQGGMNVINQLRSDVGVAQWHVESAAEAWVALKRERGIELWLEGRRLGDLHRWLADGSPGAVEDMTGRSTCFPIGQNELAANPNL